MIPNSNILIGTHIEGKYEILESNTHSGGWNQKQFSVAAFDNDLTSIFDLCYASEYFIIDIKQKSNIYRYTNYYAGKIYNDRLKIVNIETNEDVTNLYTLDLSKENNKWELFVKDIPKGIYKFSYEPGGKTSARVDSEWFIEQSYNLKEAIKNTILNNKLIQEHVPFLEKK